MTFGFLFTYIVVPYWNSCCQRSFLISGRRYESTIEFAAKIAVRVDRAEVRENTKGEEGRERKIKGYEQERVLANVAMRTD